MPLIIGKGIAGRAGMMGNGPGWAGLRILAHGVYANAFLFIIDPSVHVIPW